MATISSTRSTTFDMFKQVANEAVAALGYAAMKEEQLEVVCNILDRDVFAVLPTGFGKTLCYSSLPFIFDKLSLSPSTETEPSIVIVVTPLIAIMKDQVSTLQSRGVSAAYVAADQKDRVIKEGIKLGRYQLVFFTPELLLDCNRWRKVLVGDVYSKRLKAFVVDEAHTVKKWGDTFRESMSRIGEIRSLLPPDVNILALTATASRNLRIGVAKTLGMRNEHVISLTPCKANIIYRVSTFTNMDKTFHPLVQRLRSERVSFPRMIIYCRRYEECADLYIYFKEQLRDEFTEPCGIPDMPGYRLVDMYLSCTEPCVKEEILRGITQESVLRIVICTVAFGMGVDCPDIRQIIHIGCSSDVEMYVQETGRAGRDGHPALALLLNKSNSTRFADAAMKEYAANTSQCRRDALFGNFDNYIHVRSETPCLCCDICMADCDCGTCICNQCSR